MYKIVNNKNIVQEITVDNMFKMLRHVNIVVYKTNTSLRVLRCTDAVVTSDTQYSFVDMMYSGTKPTFAANTIEDSIQKALNQEITLYLFRNFDEFVDAYENNLIH